MNKQVLKVLAPIAKLFPKQIRSYRYKKWTNKRIDWNNPQDIQQYLFIEYFKKYAVGDLGKFADLTDKFKVREFVKERIGEEYLTKLYGAWDTPDDINFSLLPEKFALKTNNGCGTNIIIRDKSTELDEEKAKKDLKKWLSFPYGALTGQPHYSMIKPLVIAEEFLDQDAQKEILPYDYKIFCFRGKPQFILYYEGREVNGHIVQNMAFDLDWKPMPDVVNNPISRIIPKPESFDKMIEIAEKLSKGFDFVRVDLYEINGHPIFGEMTFTPDMITNFTPEFLSMKNMKRFLDKP